ncbi:MAG: substrate-binding periplasmic protein [Succinivibrio sp.]
MAKYVYLLLIILPLAIIGTGFFEYYQRSNKTIYVGVDGYSAPFSVTNDMAELSGYGIDVMQAVADAVGMKIEFRIIPSSALRESLRIGAIDIVIAPFDSNNSHNKGLTDFSLPYFENIMTYVVRREDKDMEISKNSLKSKNVCLTDKPYVLQHIRTTQYNSNIKIYTSSALCFKALLERQCDVVADSKSSNNYYITKHKLRTVNSIEIKYTPVHQYKFAVKEGRQELIDRINRGLIYINQTNLLNEIHQKWFSSDSTLSYGKVNN